MRFFLGMPCNMDLGTPMLGGMTASEIIDALGGTTAVAKLCAVRAPSVSEWRHKGIPPAREMYLRAIRPHVFSVEVEKRATA